MSIAKTRTPSSEKLSVFADEMFATTGGIYGMLFGLDTAVFQLSQSISPVESYIHNLAAAGESVVYGAAMGAIIGKVVSTAGPLLVHSIKAKLDNLSSVEETYRYNDYADYSGPRKAGIGVGTVAALALAWNLSINPFEAKEVPHVEPLSPHLVDIAQTPYAQSNTSYILNGVSPA